MTRIILISFFVIVLFVPFDTDERAIGYVSDINHDVLLVSTPLKGLILPERMVFAYFTTETPNLLLSTKSFFLKLFWWRFSEILRVYSSVPTQNVYMLSSALSPCNSDQLVVIDSKKNELRCEVLPYKVVEDRFEIEFIQANSFVSSQMSFGWKDTKQCRLDIGIVCRYLDHQQINTENSISNSLGRIAKCELKRDEIELEYREKVVPYLNYLPYFQIQLINECLEKIDPGSFLLDFHRTILRKRETRSIEI